MRPPSLTFVPSLVGLIVVLALGATRLAAQDPGRFSQSLSVAERTECGLAKLSSDQVAVIDALVRRDTGTRGASATAAETPAVFSRRLTADERKTAGLTTVAPVQIAKIDALVERYQAGRLARTLLAPPSFLTPQRSALRESDTRKPKERELHGTFSLSMGWGSGGYSEKTGAMSVTMEDPARGYSVTIGYSETHVKGGPLIYRDPYYDLHPGPLDDPLRP